jgi:flavin reductase (DIM6/NTAB) family NADH-FMN oxidoreductase RutF
MRSLPSPVTILTTTSPLSPSPGVGITLSTLTCLSLSPHPLITFNIKLPSATSTALHAHPSKAFCIHLLSATPHAAFLAESFAQLAANGPNQKASPWRKLLGGAEKWAEEDGVPMLGAADAVVSRLRCRAEKVMLVEDHEIWVGKVVGVEDFAGKRVEGRVGLGYADRVFRGVGTRIWPDFGDVGEVGGGRWVELGEEFREMVDERLAERDEREALELDEDIERHGGCRDRRR